MKLKYGPEGCKSRDLEYVRHQKWCYDNDREATYAEYQALRHVAKHYGPPGAHYTSNESTRHRLWCRRNGEVSHEEYLRLRGVARKLVSEPGPTMKRILENKRKTQLRFIGMGLLKVA